MKGVIIALLIAFSIGVLGGSIDIAKGDAWVNSTNSIIPNSSLSNNVNITGNFTASNGALFQRNITMQTPNGSRYNCGVNNTGSWSCT